MKKMRLLVRWANWVARKRLARGARSYWRPCTVCDRLTLAPPVICCNCSEAILHLDRASYTKYLLAVKKK